MNLSTTLIQILQGNVHSGAHNALRTSCLLDDNLSWHQSLQVVSILTDEDPLQAQDYNLDVQEVCLNNNQPCQMIMDHQNSAILWPSQSQYDTVRTCQSHLGLQSSKSGLAIQVYLTRNSSTLTITFSVVLEPAGNLIQNTCASVHDLANHAHRGQERQSLPLCLIDTESHYTSWWQLIGLRLFGRIAWFLPQLQTISTRQGRSTDLTTILACKAIDQYTQSVAAYDILSTLHLCCQEQTDNMFKKITSVQVNPLQGISWPSQSPSRLILDSILFRDYLGLCQRHFKSVFLLKLLTDISKANDSSLQRDNALEFPSFIVLWWS